MMEVFDYCIEIVSGERGLTFSPNSPLRILSDGLNGFDMVDFSVDFGYYLDGRGAFVKKVGFRERMLGIRFEIGEEDAKWRREILGIAKPGKECMITAVFGGVCRRIEAIVSEKVKFEWESGWNRTVVSLRFAACEPFFMGDTVVADRLSEPLNNSGDVPCGAVFTVRAAGGSVVNPSISRGGDTFSVEAVLEDGDVAVIDTRDGRKGISINGEACYSFDWMSRFFRLDVGENVLSADADSGKEFMAVHAAFAPLYYGV